MKSHTKIFYVLAATLLFACSKKPKGSPGKNEVWLEYKTFVPQQIEINKGETINFINKDNASHTMVDGGGTFNSGSIKGGKTYSYTFSNSGTYNAFCNYHSNLNTEKLTIIVK